MTTMETTIRAISMGIDALTGPVFEREVGTDDRR